MDLGKFSFYVILPSFICGMLGLIVTSFEVDVPLILFQGVGVIGSILVALLLVRNIKD